MPKSKYNPTDEKILELSSKLEAEVYEHRRTKKALSESLKKAAIFPAIYEELRHSVKPIRGLPPAKVQKKNIKHTEHAVMHHSDSHMDEIVLPHTVGGLEEYNFEIALARAEHYVDSVIEITQQTLTTYEFPVLWILAYGDFTSGEIHEHVERSAFKNQLKNSLMIAKAHSLMYRDLAPYFDEIKVVCLSGNHGRRSVKKNYNGPQDNWDYLVSETARLLCQDIPNIEFLIPDAFSINLDINGHGFHIEHGDSIKSWNGLPFYGIERKSRRLTALHNAQGKQVKNFVYGHHHTASTMAALTGETIMNGAWIGTNPYVYEEFSGYNTPSQWLHGVHHEQGITWRHKINLKREKEKPVRYDILLAE